MNLTLPALMTELGQLGVAMQKFAAIGTALRLRASGQTVASEVDAAMRDVLSIVLPGSLDGLTEDEVCVALNYVAFQLEEAREMLRDPARPPVWQIDDPAVLQTMGDLSRALPRRILAFAAERPALAAAVTGRFLDVGTGVGAIALETAARCPTLRVVGLDIWEPALALARANVAASPYSDRIEIRTQSVSELDETAAYTLAFLAAPFMSRDVIERALDRLSTALAPDGYLVIALYIPQEDRVAGALTALRRARSGGYAWTVDEVGAAITRRGFGEIEIQPGPAQVSISPTLVFARRFLANADVRSSKL